ncbi:hypothetical protein A2773_06235 [Candidatus Gottesmanbacteria bacterium RIFCSPHIGHO2_01_FULL_39_10]|uniref:HYR domain-containing protein n=1 Tax=Candidatus Gottesmanbacteria bacterium RIFCSPHIGHO2_01_FULL_39_10 TaxID=1798375 RepID=A0A1F5ZMU4_9BACT|nr:MAG: hypothetical protein A2773_06235 [Candidatus Gottesmanbacteria bacterium RIFCSPHIGHO2_01_FULL_39_10]
MNTKNMNIIIAVGVVALVILGGGFYFLSQRQEPIIPVNKLACKETFFNYVVGKPEIIVTAKGEDTKETSSVNCQFSYTTPDGTPSASTITADLKDAPGGKSWGCIDKDKLFPKGSTQYEVTVTDNRGETSTCQSTIFLQ